MLTFGSQFGIEMVDLFVGPTKQQFRVHKALLCSRVEYFRQMFDSGFIEAEENSGFLPDEDPIVFSLFLEYIYGGGRLGPVDIERSTTATGPVIDRIKLYGFAERIGLVDLADYIMTNLVSNLAYYERTPSKDGMKLAYEVTKPGSPLRNYMSHSLYYIMKFDDDESAWSTRTLCDTLKETDDLLFDLVAVTRKHEASQPASIKRSIDPRVGSKCRWHSHPDGKHCLLQGDIL
jgi:hypothetical protein